MALAIDVKSNFASGSGQTATTTSFTPAASTLLVAVVGIGNGNGVAGSGSTVISDSRSGSWTLRAREVMSGGSVAEVWCRDGTTSAAMTVTATSQITGQIDVCLQVFSLSGAAVTASQSAGATKTQGTTSFTASIVTTVTGSFVAGALGYSDNQIVLTAATGTTMDGEIEQVGGGDTEAAFHATSMTGTPGSTSFGFTNSTGFTVALALAEFVPPSTATTLVRPFRSVNPAVLTASAV